MTDSRKKMRACIVIAILAALLILESGWISMQATDISARRRSGISYGEKERRGCVLRCCSFGFRVSLPAFW